MQLHVVPVKGQNSFTFILLQFNMANFWHVKQFEFARKGLSQFEKNGNHVCIMLFNFMLKLPSSDIAQMHTCRRVCASVGLNWNHKYHSVPIHPNYGTVRDIIHNILHVLGRYHEYSSKIVGQYTHVYLYRMFSMNICIPLVHKSVYDFLYSHKQSNLYNLYNLA